MRHIPLFDKQLYTLQTLYLLPRDKEGLYNSLNYRRLRSFLLGQMTEHRWQHQLVGTRHAVSVNAKMTSWMFRTRHAVSLLGGTKFADD